MTLKQIFTFMTSWIIESIPNGGVVFIIKVCKLKIYMFNTQNSLNLAYSDLIVILIVGSRQVYDFIMFLVCVDCVLL